jgi:Mn2+/Fe2+ NRAMP family transporter
MSQPKNKPSFLAIIGPGLLVAATGVGAGDLATGALSGSRLGVAVLWAVLVGAFMKFVLNEGLARWQLATGSTVLEGTAKHVGRFALVLFLVYLVVWSFFVGAALMSACGVAMHALLPIAEDPNTDKIVYGILHSGLAVALVLFGGYKLFGKVMSVCIAAMFAIVFVNTIAIRPDWGAAAIGAIVPKIPQLDGEGLSWTVGLMGGVGGTVTVLCYGYWIREEKREGLEQLKNCRLDLVTGYVATALFGMCMVILGSQIKVSGKGAALVVDLASQLNDALGSVGPVASIAFMIGAWGAIFSSMFGVWQSVPYLFEDCLKLLKRTTKPNEEPSSSDENDASKGAAASPSKSPAYNWSLYLIATIPILGLFTKFDQIQLAYALVGAAFMPLLAMALLFLNGSKKRVGESGRNSTLTTIVLVLIIAMFVLAGAFDIRKRLTKKTTQSSPTAVNAFCLSAVPAREESDG